MICDAVRRISLALCRSNEGSVLCYRVRMRSLFTYKFREGLHAEMLLLAHHRNPIH